MIETSKAIKTGFIKDNFFNVVDQDIHFEMVVKIRQYKTWIYFGAMLKGRSPPE
jgi:hypothetical protein